MTFGVGDGVSRYVHFAANCGQIAESGPTPARLNPYVLVAIGPRLRPSILAVA